MIPIKIGSVNYNLPASWQEVPFATYRELVNRSIGNGGSLDLPDILNVLCGVEVNDVMNMNMDQFNKMLLPLMQWVNVHPTPDAVALPESVTINGIEIRNINSSLKMSDMPYGMWIESTQIVYPINPETRARELNSKPLTDYGARLCAVNLQMNYSGTYTGISRYDEQVVDELITYIDQLPCTEVVAMTHFFYHRFKRLMKQDQKH